MEAKAKFLVDAYFATGENQFDNDLLIQFFNNLNLKISFDTIREGLEIKNITQTLKSNILRIIKMMLLRKKIIFYGSPASLVSKTIVSIISLIPGALENKLLQLPNTLTKFGLPFELFDENYIIHPYLPIQNVTIIIYL